MKIRGIICDHCDERLDFAKVTIELGKIEGIFCPQISRDDGAPAATSEPPVRLSVYDFCSMECLRSWILTHDL
jgi:hypothetical protein